MVNKVDKSYLISDVYEPTGVNNYQRKIESSVLECYIINFPSMWLIQTKQGSKRWLESLDLCLDSSRSYKINKKSVNLALVY